MRRVLVCFALVFFVLAGNAQSQEVTCPHTPNGPLTEKDVLIALYCATAGDGWSNSDGWSTTESISSNWHGVTVSNSVVTALLLQGNNLTGTIPTELGNLTNLTHLYLYNNELTGTIPAELGALTVLTELLLNGNNLTGTIPTELGNLTNLITLNLFDNELTGTIPAELGALTVLRGLHLNGNNLTGTISTELGNLSSLEALNLLDNELTGTIPAELGALTVLTGLHLNGNNLTGTIPTQLGNLTNLETLNLKSNNLTGTIPTQLGNLTNLITLLLNGNKLTGPIPTELEALTALTALNLDENELTGTILAELGALTALTGLYLSSNKLTGTIPTELKTLTTLTDLRLRKNELTGTIPAELKTLTALAILLLDGNKLTGPIPTELKDLTALAYLFLHRNELSEPIPTELGALTALIRLALFDNELTGPIPTELGALTALTELRLDGNKLTGTIPTELGALTALTDLRLNGNKLTETIPTELQSLTALQLLAFWDNADLVFSISDELGKKADRAALLALHSANKAGEGTWFPSDEDETDLFSYSLWRGITTDDATGRVSGLDLRSSGMTGEITSALASLGGLESLNISGNRSLAGTLPLRLTELSNLTTLDMRCTGVGVPGDANFQAWLNGITFRRVCPPPPRPPSPPPPSSPPPSSPASPVIESAQGVLHSGDAEDGFSLTPVGEGGSIVYGQRTIDVSVTGDADVSSGNPAVIISGGILDRVNEITFELSEVSPEDPPSGFRLANYAAEVDLMGVELAEGETVTVCLPLAEGEGYIHHYDEAEGEWERLGTVRKTVNRVPMLCAETDAFPLFAVFVEEEEIIPPSPSAPTDGSGGCAVAAANGEAGTTGWSENAVFNLLLTMSVLLWIPGRNLSRQPDAGKAPPLR